MNAFEKEVKRKLYWNDLHKMIYCQNNLREQIALNVRKSFDKEEQKIPYFKRMSKNYISNQVIYFITETMSYSKLILYTGLYESCQKEDFSYFHHAIFQSVRFQAISYNQLDSGYDHCINFEFAVYAFAGHDKDFAKTLLPYKLGISENGNTVLKAATNMLMGIFYSDETLLNVGRIAALKKCTTKSVFKLDRAILEYLIALDSKDVPKLNECLLAICELTQSNCWLNSSISLDKEFCLFAHGLYNIAYYYLEPELFEKIQKPNFKSFWIELIDYQKSIKYQCGKPYIVFTGEFDILNKAIYCTPYVKLIKEIGVRYSNTNAEAYKRDFFLSLDIPIYDE